MKRNNALNLFIQKQKEVIENIEKSILIYKTDADLDEEDTIDPEDFSHQSESKDMQLRFEQHLKEEMHKLKILEAELKKESAIKFIESRNYLILLGLSVPMFKYNKSNIGISESAPIYNSLGNLLKGDDLKLGNTVEKIEDVF